MIANHNEILNEKTVKLEWLKKEEKNPTEGKMNEKKFKFQFLILFKFHCGSMLFFFSSSMRSEWSQNSTSFYVSSAVAFLFYFDYNYYVIHNVAFIIIIALLFALRLRKSKLWPQKEYYMLGVCCALHMRLAADAKEKKEKKRNGKNKKIPWYTYANNNITFVQQKKKSEKEKIAVRIRRILCVGFFFLQHNDYVDDLLWNGLNYVI